MESQLIQVSLMLKVFMMRYWGYQRRATRGRNAETPRAETALLWL